MGKLMAQARRGGLITDAETATSSPATLAAATRAGACAGWWWQRRARLSEEISFLAKSPGLSHAYLPGSAAASPEVSHGAWLLLLPWERGSHRIPALGARRLLAGSLAPAGQHTGSSMPNPTSTRRFGHPEVLGRRHRGRPCAHTRSKHTVVARSPGFPRPGSRSRCHPTLLPGAAELPRLITARYRALRPGAPLTPVRTPRTSMRGSTAGAGGSQVLGGCWGPPAPSPPTPRPHSPRARSRGYLARSACVSSQR